MLFTYHTILQIANQCYLFRYKSGKFEANFRNNNQEILNILLKPNLNRIIIINQNRVDYILIYESFKHYSIDPVELRESDEDNVEFLKGDDSYIDVYFDA